jgi:hypothetical protein
VRAAENQRFTMSRYYYMENQGNIRGTLVLPALHKIGLPPATKILLEAAKKHATLRQASQGEPAVLPSTPSSSSEVMATDRTLPAPAMPRQVHGP